MSTIAFPTNPTINDTHLDSPSDTTWKWTGVYWQNWTKLLTGENAATNALIIAGVVGEIIVWADSTIPDNFLACEGQAISRTLYTDLFEKLSTRYGVGDGSTTFNLPDYRGMFLRGLDESGLVDPDGSGRSLGDTQSDENKSHVHGVSYGNTVNVASSAGVTFKSDGVFSDFNATGTNQEQAISADGGDETRPKNASVIYCIRYARDGNLSGSNFKTDLDSTTNTNVQIPSALAVENYVQNNTTDETYVQTYVANNTTPESGTLGDVVSSLLTESQYQNIQGSGWVLADGRSVSGSSYHTLTSNSNIPDLRGRFLRGLDPTNATDPDGSGRSLGDDQSDAYKSHKDGVYYNIEGYTGGGGGGDHVNGAHHGTVGTTYSGYSETRPKNTSVNYFIKIN